MYIVRFRSGTLHEWNKANPTLRSGEIGRVVDGTFKVGDGKTAWLDLPFSDKLPEQFNIPHSIRCR